APGIGHGHLESAAGSPRRGTERYVDSVLDYRHGAACRSLLFDTEVVVRNDDTTKIHCEGIVSCQGARGRRDRQQDVAEVTRTWRDIDEALLKLGADAGRQVHRGEGEGVQGTPGVGNSQSEGCRCPLARSALVGDEGHDAPMRVPVHLDGRSTGKDE